MKTSTGSDELNDRLETTLPRGPSSDQLSGKLFVCEFEKKLRLFRQSEGVAIGLSGTAIEPEMGSTSAESSTLGSKVSKKQPPRDAAQQLLLPVARLRMPEQRGP